MNRVFILSALVPLSLLLFSEVSAQGREQSFVQTRFVGTDSENCPAGECAAKDGVLHFLLKPVGGLTQEVFTDDDNEKAVRFEVRARSNLRDLRYRSGAVYIQYSTDAFGARAASSCKISDAGVFEDNPNYTVNLRGVSEDMMKISVTNTVDKSVTLSSDYEIYATVECKVADTEQDAGLALQAMTYKANSIWGYDDTNTTATVLAYADNDLRGFRLDGKTWAEDYVRRGDNQYAILKFSKRIKTQLDTHHFEVSLPDVEIVEVNHVPGADEVAISFDAGSGDHFILNLTSSRTVTVLDIKDNALAGGSFLADMNPSIITAPGISQAEVAVTEASCSSDIQSTWDVGFDTSIIVSTMNTDNLCLAERSDYSCPESSAQTPFIVSVMQRDKIRFIPDDASFSVVVNGITEKRKTALNLYLRTKRHAVLGDEESTAPIVPVVEMSEYGHIQLCDTIGPRITVRAMPRVVRPSENGERTLKFRVTADETVQNLDEIGSYKVLQVLKDGSAEPTNIASITELTSIDDLTVMIISSVNTSGDLGDIVGFTLGVNDDPSVLTDEGGNAPINEMGETLKIGEALDAHRLAIATTSALECAAIYPYIGQTELFLQIHDDTSVNRDGFVIDGEAVNRGSVQQLSATSASSVYKVTLDEITASSIAVEYYSPTADSTTPTATATCIASLVADIDGDGRADIADVQPFDADNSGINRTVARPRSLAAAPAESAIWYSRSWLVPSLLERRDYTYIEVEGNQPTKKKFSKDTAMTAQEYFGVTDDGAKLFRSNTDATVACPILAQAAALNLTKVKIAEHCVDVTDSLSRELPGSFIYSWVKVNARGNIASLSNDYNIRVLPEINFVGQDSYVYTEANTKAVNISAYMGDFSGDSEVIVGQFPDQGSIARTTQTVTLNRLGRVATGLHTITAPTNPGSTITYWLDETPNVWHPKSNELVPVAGGYTSQFDAAIGRNNHVDVKVSEAEQEITRIHQILLYDVMDPEGLGEPIQTFATVTGRTYYAVVDFTTNIQNIETSVDRNLANDRYQIQDVEIPSEDLNMITPSLIGNDHDIITFTISTSTIITNSTSTIVTGWSRIGNLTDIKTSHLVIPTIPSVASDYRIVDRDKDRIADNREYSNTAGNNTRLHIFNEDNAFRANDYLAAHYSRPLYMSDLGYIIALADNFRYHTPSIAYDRLSDETKTLLDIRETGFDSEVTTPVETLVTYGAREIDFSIGSEGQAAGGVVHTVFPVEASEIGETLYLGIYNQNRKLWENFGRDAFAAYADTWYAIPRLNANVECPTDIEIYRKEHQAAATDDFGFTASAENCVMVVITDGGPHDGEGFDGRVSVPLSVGAKLFNFEREQRLECTSFYPHVGQRELFFRLTSKPPVQESQLTLTQNGSNMDAQVNRIGKTVEDVSILRARLDAEITDSADIVATYTAPDGTRTEIQCVADNFEANMSFTDTDADGVPDVADSMPYDRTVSDKNPDVASASQLAAAPSELDTYYSRNTIIRSLLRGDRFIYSEETADGQFIMKSAPTMSAAEYFGVENVAARIFRVEPGSLCSNMLNAIRANNLNSVRIGEFCPDVTENLADQSVGMNEYIWAKVENGILMSDYRSYPNVRILAEIRMSSQPSYLYAAPTTKSIIISADIGETDNRQIQILRSDTQQPITLTLKNVDDEMAEAEYFLTRRGMHPNKGQTVTHRLLVRIPDEAVGIKTAPQRGGSLSSPNYDYATLFHNRVDVRVAAADELVTHIHHILLYDLSQAAARRVKSVVNDGRSYALRVYYKTNTTSTEIVETLPEGYTVDDDITADIEIERNNEGYLYEQITFAVNDDASGSITVGWDTVGRAEDIRATYLVTEDEPANYAAMDDDMNGIPDSLQMGDHQILQVAIAGNPLRTEDALRTDGNGRVLFASDVGSIIAIGKGGNDEMHHSAANIKYTDLEDETIAALGFSKDDAIETIVTFGIRNVEYAIGSDENIVAGGVTYTTFPVESSSPGKTLYLSKYDSDADQWKNFKRENGEAVDTWYAIERPHNNRQCPTDINIYMNGHQSSGDRGLGFVASAQNCVMVVITDGGPYDNSGLDNRVIDPLAIGERTFAAASGGGGSGGGGSVGIVNVLLLSLLLLLIATQRYRRLSRSL